MHPSGILLLPINYRANESLSIQWQTSVSSTYTYTQHTSIRTDYGLIRSAAAHLEDDLHVVLLTVDARVRLARPGRQRNEVVVLAGTEFQSARLWREWSKCDRVVAIEERLITDGDGASHCRIRNVAAVVLLLGDLSTR